MEQLHKQHKSDGIGLDVVSMGLLVGGLIVLDFGMDYSGKGQTNNTKIWLGILMIVASDLVDKYDRDRREKYLCNVIIPATHKAVLSQTCSSSYSNSDGMSDSERSIQAGIDLAESLAKADAENERRKQRYDIHKYCAATVTPLDLPDGTYGGALLGYNLTVQGITATTDCGLRNVVPKQCIVDVVNKVGYVRQFK